MSQASAFEQYLLELINAARAKVGAQPLAFNDNINTAAELHSQWMINTDTFSHTGAGGSSFTTRMANAGYQFVSPWAGGENIGWASLRGDPGYQDEVLLLHNNLMNSSGHRANLLSPTYREVGLGSRQSLRAATT
jgi:serralysin